MVFALVASSASSSARVMASRQAVRAFSTSKTAGKDLVQEAYIRELQAYKPAPKAANAHEGQVREFHAPKAPQAPSVPSSSDISGELSSFSSSEPDHAAKGESTSDVSPEARQDVNAFLEDLKKPLEVEAHH